MGPANNGMARYCKECENEIPAGYDICPTCGALVDGTGNYYDEVDDEEGIGNKRFGFNLRKLKQQRERRSAYQDEDVTDEKARGGRTDDTQLRSAGGDGGTVGVGQWLITLLLLCIPLVNIILIIKWAVDKTTLPSKKNFARAQLVMIVLSMMLSILFMAIMGSVVASALKGLLGSADGSLAGLFSGTSRGEELTAPSSTMEDLFNTGEEQTPTDIANGDSGAALNALGQSETVSGAQQGGDTGYGDGVTLNGNVSIGNGDQYSAGEGAQNAGVSPNTNPAAAQGVGYDEVIQKLKDTGVSVMQPIDSNLQASTGVAVRMTVNNQMYFVFGMKIQNKGAEPITPSTALFVNATQNGTSLVMDNSVLKSEDANAVSTAIPAGSEATVFYSFVVSSPDADIQVSVESWDFDSKVIIQNYPR